MSGTLFIVATPIGNLEDLTPRARQTLSTVDLVAAEDTRHTLRLLSNIGAKPTLLALHDHNEERAVHGIIESLKDGKDVALVSDAGTPLVSDPGFRLVRAAHEHDIAVVPLPGASAAIVALSAAGLPTDRFCFEGFLPSRQSGRRKALEALASESRTMVFYESVHRVSACLDDMIEAFGEDRQAFIGRELTKIHEQCTQESLGELKRKLDHDDIRSKGEFVLIVAGGEPRARSDVDTDRMLVLLAEHLRAKEVARIVATLTGKKKNALYERLLELREKVRKN